jgi:hypothetical protein
MTLLEEKILHRFQKSKITRLAKQNPTDIDLLLIATEKRSPIQVLMTDGLSAYEQPVPEKFTTFKHIELYFCLPSYWDLEDVNNPTMNWVKPWIQKLAKHLIEKQTWYGVGHTFPNGNPVEAISPTMKQKYFLLNVPTFMAEELQPMELDGKTVEFLAIVPIFEDELDYKMGKGTYKLQKKFLDKNITELLDDYRMSTLKNKWRIFR